MTHSLSIARDIPAFNVEVGLVVFSSDGQARFGWRDLSTGEFHPESYGARIAKAVGAIELVADMVH